MKFVGYNINYLFNKKLLHYLSSKIILEKILKFLLLNSFYIDFNDENHIQKSFRIFNVNSIYSEDYIRNDYLFGYVYGNSLLHDIFSFHFLNMQFKLIKFN